MTYLETAETLMNAQAIVNRTKDSIRTLFLENYFGDEEGNFKYEGAFKENSRYDAVNFSIDELPGWEFACSEIEEGGGYVTYAVLCYAPGIGKGVKFSSNATFVIELATE